MATKSKKYNRPEQQKSKTTKQKVKKERAVDEKDYVKEEILQYYNHNKPLFV